MAALSPEGTPVVVGDVVITSPGLSGEVEVHQAASPGMRAAEDTRQALIDALQRADVSEQLTVEIKDQSELDDSGGTRGGGGGDEIVVEVPAPGSGNGQVLLYAAEDGSLSWHLPEIPPEEVPSRGGESRTYRIPRQVVAPETDGGGQRGLLGAVGKKLLKVLVFPLVDPVLGTIGNHFAARYEEKHARAALRPWGVEDYRLREVPDLLPERWPDLASGVSLLMIHGTFSTAQSAFSNLTQETVQELHNRYGGRVFALDHHTISVTPSDNIAWLAQHLPASGDPVTVDVVTHSRGGLVGRALAERAGDLGIGDRITVRNLVMVAPPNAGTALADKEHISALLDRLTNIAQLLPDNGFLDALDLIVAVVKQVAVGAFGGMEGLMSMNPSGPTLAAFNDSPGSGATYRVMASNFEPKPGSALSRIARDAATDFVFGTTTNDLVVPTDGAWSLPATSGFPVADPFVLGPEMGVDHSSYFGRADVEAKLLEWLPGS
jgi:pimeloyl-ACP methyl ester carboxylesterase